MHNNSDSSSYSSGSDTYHSDSSYSDDDSYASGGGNDDDQPAPSRSRRHDDGRVKVIATRLVGGAVLEAPPVGSAPSPRSRARRDGASGAKDGPPTRTTTCTTRPPSTRSTAGEHGDDATWFADQICGTRPLSTSSSGSSDATARRLEQWKSRKVAMAPPRRDCRDDVAVVENDNDDAAVVRALRVSERSRRSARALTLKEVVEGGGASSGRVCPSDRPVGGIPTTATVVRYRGTAQKSGHTTNAVGSSPTNTSNAVTLTKVTALAPALPTLTTAGRPASRSNSDRVSSRPTVTLSCGDHQQSLHRHPTLPNQLYRTHLTPRAGLSVLTTVTAPVATVAPMAPASGSSTAAESVLARMKRFAGLASRTHDAELTPDVGVSLSTAQASAL